MKRSLVWIAGLALALVGCGGGETVTTSEISGTVYDVDGNPVRNVHVYYGNTNTWTSSNGGYVLSTLPAKDVLVRAEVSRNGTRYYGQNVGRTFNGERTKSVNIVLYPENTIAGIHGVVHDRNGHVVEGARIFVRENASGTTLSGATAVSNENGEYNIGGLGAGIPYRVLCNASGFSTDSDIFTLNSDENRITDLLISDATSIYTPPVPTGLLAESWTTPFSATRGISASATKNAYANIKSFVHGKTNRAWKTASKRNTSNGNWIEIDLTWNQMSDLNDLMGFGIYRGTSSGSLHSLDFLRDPMAEIFEDLDANLSQNQTYYYAVSSLSTTYSSDGTGESALSSVASAYTLPDIITTNASGSPVTISWNSVSGATGYAVYVFSELPTINVTSIYNNYSSPTTATSLQVPISLTSGHKYYYIVQALANFDNGVSAYLSNSLSPIGSFTAP